MSDLHDQVVGDRDFFTRILGKIPGFKGYIEREGRRSSDKMLREMVSQRFEEQWQRISALQRDLISSGGLSFVDDLEASALKIRQFVDRVKTASYGYAGFFDAKKINEAELVKLYEYDLSLLTQVDEVKRAIDHVEASIGTDGLPASIRNLTSVAQSSVDLFNRRDEVILSTQAAE